MLFHKIKLRANLHQTLPLSKQQLFYEETMKKNVKQLMCMCRVYAYHDYKPQVDPFPVFFFVFLQNSSDLLTALIGGGKVCQS